MKKARPKGVSKARKATRAKQTRSISQTTPSVDDEESARRTYWAVRLLLMMVAELHRRGYERLRIAPYMVLSGLYWRCDFVPRACVLRTHGARVASSVEDRSNKAVYSTGSKFNFFEWGDCSRCSPVELADRFEQTFRDVMVQCRETDPDYVAWYQQMLHLTEPLGVVFAFADWETPDGAMSVAGETPTNLVPLPPPGEQPQ